MFINVCGSSKLPLPGGWTKGQVPPEVRTALCWPACAGWGRRGGCWVLHARKQGLLGGGCCCLYPACCCSRPTQPDARPRILSAITPIAGEAAPGGEAGWRGARRHARFAQLGPATHRSRPPGSALPGWVLPLLMSGGAACCMSARWQRSLTRPAAARCSHSMACVPAHPCTSPLFLNISSLVVCPQWRTASSTARCWSERLSTAPSSCSSSSWRWAPQHKRWVLPAAVELPAKVLWMPAKDAAEQPATQADRSAG